MGVAVFFRTFASAPSLEPRTIEEAERCARRSRQTEARPRHTFLISACVPKTIGRSPAPIAQHRLARRSGHASVTARRVGRQSGTAA